MEIQVQCNLANRTSITAKGIDEETKRALFFIKIEAKGEEAKKIAKQRDHWGEELVKMAQDIKMSLEDN
jgi:hypothetical protein